MPDPEQGYTRARKTLRDLFGQPFKVARNLIEGVMAEAKRTKGDVYTMADLVIKLQNCSIVPDHLVYRADLDAMHTLENIVRHISPELQGR